MTDATLLDYWPTPERLDECVGAQSDAVFLAVRPPVRLRRIIPDVPCEVVSERQFLEEFLRLDPPGGRVFAAIEDGPYVAGLIRSLTIRLRLGSGADRRHTVVFSGGISPQELVRQSLVGLTGPGYDALRAELDAPSEPVGRPTPPGPDALAAALRERVAETRMRLEADPAPARAALEARRRKAPIDQATQAVLDDIDLIGWLGPGLAEWLTTPATNAAIISALAEGREVHESDFLLDSLPAGGSPPFRSVVKNFTSTDENGGRTARTLAAQLVHSLLPPPTPSPPPARGPNELFAELSARLVTDGRELVLMVHGAMSDRLPELGEGAILRVLAIVAPSGDASQVADRWQIDPDVPLIDPEGFTGLVDRLGDFLNAARLGGAELARTLAEGSANWPPTFDPVDRLPAAERDTLEVFGWSAAGRPLFPFSRAILQDVVRRSGGTQDTAWVIDHVLVPILRENRKAFAAGAFPLPTFPEFPAPRSNVPPHHSLPELTGPAAEAETARVRATPVGALEPPATDPRQIRATEWFGFGPGFDAEQVRSAMLDALAATGFGAREPHLADRVRDFPLAALARAAVDPDRPPPHEHLLDAALALMDDFDLFLSTAEEHLRGEFPAEGDTEPARLAELAVEPVRRAREAALASLAGVEIAVRGRVEEQP
jgi:hypothetical protein